MNLPQIPPDKAQHLIYGAAAGLVGAAAAALYPHALPPWYGAMICAALVGIGKELADQYFGSGSPSWADALATVAGGGVIALATWAPALLVAP